MSTSLSSPPQPWAQKSSLITSPTHGALAGNQACGWESGISVWFGLIIVLESWEAVESHGQEFSLWNPTALCDWKLMEQLWASISWSVKSSNSCCISVGCRTGSEQGHVPRLLHSRAPIHPSSCPNAASLPPLKASSPCRISGCSWKGFRAPGLHREFQLLLGLTEGSPAYPSMPNIVHPLLPPTQTHFYQHPPSSQTSASPPGPCIWVMWPSLPCSLFSKPLHTRFLLPGSPSPGWDDARSLPGQGKKATPPSWLFAQLRTFL